MKQIYFLRHADASSLQRMEGVERPISVQGKLEASRMAFYVKDQLPAPEVCFMSHALRAQQTAKYFKEAWEIKDDNYLLTSKLYDFGGQEVLHFIYNLSEEWNSVLLIGHNFAMTEVVNHFGDKPVDILPTAGLVAIDFESDTWQGLRKGKITKIILPEAI